MLNIVVGVFLIGDGVAHMIAFFFFFQAEDGIRVLVRSRGLGDVYKRQSLHATLRARQALDPDARAATQPRSSVKSRLSQRPVSYTHLTLPTSDLV